MSVILSKKNVIPERIYRWKKYELITTEETGQILLPGSTLLSVFAGCSSDSWLGYPDDDGTAQGGGISIQSNAHADTTHDFTSALLFDFYTAEYGYYTQDYVLKFKGWGYRLTAWAYIYPAATELFKYGTARVLSGENISVTLTVNSQENYISAYLKNNDSVNEIYDETKIIYSPGTYIEMIESDNSASYPSNGQQDGYYYIRM